MYVIECKMCKAALAKRLQLAILQVSS
jgi:hypothetical protein